MIARSRTRAESKTSLDDLLVRIKAATERFDQGEHTEAKALAGHIGALVHRADDTDAVIARLGLRDELTWVDTAGVPNPKVPCPTAGLTLMNVRSRHHGAETYAPKLAMYPPVPIRTRSGEQIYSGTRIPFEHWWTNPVVKDADGSSYSRKQLVLALGDLRDPEARAAQLALEDSPSLGWVVYDDGDEPGKPLCANPVIASVRQIGYEVLRTIAEQRDVIAQAGFQKAS